MSTVGVWVLRGSGKGHRSFEQVELPPESSPLPSIEDISAVIAEAYSWSIDPGTTDGSVNADNAAKAVRAMFAKDI